MKTTLPSSTVFLLAFTAAALSQAADPIEAARATETTTLRREALVFPPKSAAIKSTFLVGPPEISIAPSLASRLGGPAITDLVRAPVENLLHNSGRFRVANRPGPYVVSATVSSFSMSQITDKRTAAFGKFFKGIIAPKIDVPSEMLEGDWSRDESQMILQCAVTLQVRDAGGVLIGGESAEVVRKDTTKNIKTELAGIRFSSGAQEPASASDGSESVQFQSRAIELATFEALLRLLPTLDAKLAEGLVAEVAPAPSAGGPATGETRQEPVAGGVAASATKAAFCSKCGNKAGESDNFCTKCGASLNR